MLALLLLPMAYAEWAETLSVSVVAPNSYPVPGVPITVIYQKQVGVFDVPLDETVGPERLDGRVEGFTDADGNFITGLIDYVRFGEVRDYYIIAGNQQLHTSVGEHVTGTKHVEVFMENFPIRRVILRALDGDGRALANASVSVTCGEVVMQKTSDSLGIVYFYVSAPATCAVSLAYGSVTLSQSIPEITQDLNLDLPLQLYDLSVRVVDDNSMPLTNVTMLVPGFPQGATDEGGRFVIRRFPSTSAYVTMFYNGRQQATNVDLKSSDFVKVVFDLLPPSISDVNYTMNGTGTARIRAMVRDPGASHSGVAGVYVRYSPNKRIWTTLPMYPTGAYTYEAALPAQEPGTEVFFVIEAVDSRSNKATSAQYSYVVPKIGGNGGGGPSLPSLGGGIDLLGIHIDYLLLLPLIAILAFLLYRLRSRNN
ncbi:Carboxypeptidase regulatory-like domain protein [Candidatus Burarchaeum australiense]|nr:Carboxypeptidase regulatory-like domain protein [Candidatus Burarchaeum australiense]